MCRETREMVAMRSSINFIMFLYLVLVSLAPLSTLAFEPDDVYFEYYCTDNGGNFTANSPYQANLKSVVSQLSDLTEFSNGFYNLSSGKSPDNVNAIAHCTGDRSRNECISCIGYTITKLRGFCPWNKESIAWSQYCMVRYANRNLFGKLENRPRRCAPSPNFASNPEEFDGVVRQLLGNLSVNATSGGPLVKYAADQTRAGFDTVYGMVQCTPDLDDRSCSSCLNFSTTELLSCCSGKTGCRDLSPSCFLRFEAGDPFYQTGFRSPPSSPTSTTPPTSTKPPTSREGKSSNATRTVIIVIASVVGLVILIVLPICIFKRQTKTLEKPINVDDITEAESLQFNFATIQNATNNFSDANKIGQGGFGTVYKGLLPGGQEIAVKRLSVNSGQGDLEFKNEVLVVAKLQHRNLVRLLGFSLKGNETLLIYEFVPNGSLDHFIFDPIKRARLDWQTRYRIIVGIARGLLYLHEDSRLRIIHRDLKAGNVLLDAEMIPRIADFGTAKLFGQDETRGNTNRIVGTYGYMAPEYVIHGQFSVKSDVFSFGVLVLEIISGQKSNRFRYNESDEYLLNFAWRNWKEGMVLYLVDPNLSDGYRDEIMRCIHIGLMCVQENVAARPTMASVVFMLNSHSTTIPVPSQPPFGMNSNVISDMSASMGTFSWVSDSNQSMSQPLPPSQNEVSITELGPR